MDPLFGQLKEIYPDKTDDELAQGINQIRQSSPETSDDEILQAAGKLQTAKTDGSYTKALVNENVKQKYGLGDYSPDKRQALVDANNAAASPIAAGLAGFGAGLAGGDVGKGFSGAMDASQAKTKGALDNFDTGRKNMMADTEFANSQRDDAQNQDKLKREMDPNSPESKIAQEAAVRMGYKGDTSKITAQQFKNFSPAMEKIYQVETNNQTRKDTMAMNTQARRDAAMAQGQAKNEKMNDDLVRKMQEDLDPNKARGGNLAKNQAQLDQADRLKGLYTEASGDIRNLDSRQMEELAIGMNKMLSGANGGSAEQVKALLPNTVVGNAQKLKEWIMNDPQGSDQKAFVSRMAETVERERQIAQDQVRTAQVQRLSAYSKLKGNDPDRYKQVLNGYGIDDSDIDDKGQYKRGTKKMDAPMNASAQMAVPKTGEVQDGHRYKGGNPADPSSWEKI